MGDKLFLEFLEVLSYWNLVMVKIQPAVETIEFSIDNSTNPRFISLSHAASVVNRRFYRAGLSWVVGGFTIIAPSGTSGLVKVSKLPQTWVISNSWHKMYAAWKKQQDDAVEEGQLQSVVAKYRDFKVFMDVDHTDTLAPHSVPPVDMDGNPFLASEEWLYSQIVIPNDTAPGVTGEYTVHMLGADAPLPMVSKSVVLAYSNSRSTPQSPDPASPGDASVGTFAQMFNVGLDDEEIIQNVEFRNNELPYDQDVYPGMATNAPTTQLHNIVSINTTTVPWKYSLSGGVFPCGLIRIDNATEVALTFIVSLVPGPSRGYLTQPMQDM